MYCKLNFLLNNEFLCWHKCNMIVKHPNNKQATYNLPSYHHTRDIIKKIMHVKMHMCWNNILIIVTNVVVGQHLGYDTKWYGIWRNNASMLGIYQTQTKFSTLICLSSGEFTCDKKYSTKMLICSPLGAHIENIKINHCIQCLTFICCEKKGTQVITSYSLV